MKTTFELTFTKELEYYNKIELVIKLQKKPETLQLEAISDVIENIEKIAKACIGEKPNA